MVDIQSPTAEISQGKKKKNERRKINTAAKYNGLSITMGRRDKYGNVTFNAINTFCKFN